MDAVTIEKLSAINRRFYDEHALSFDRARKAAWPGFARVLEHVEVRFSKGSSRRPSTRPLPSLVIDAQPPQSSQSSQFTQSLQSPQSFLSPKSPQPRVLDLGCGNGRFARALLSRIPEADYVGVDTSEALLEIASAALTPELAIGRVRLLQGDIMAPSWNFVDAGPKNGPAMSDFARFDVVAAFGLLHHVPGFQTRAHLLERMSLHLALHGLMVVSFWQFGEARSIPWSDYNAAASEPIDPTQLEEGDLLLAWGDRRVPRYCHRASDEEVLRLTSSLDLKIVESFRADGRTGKSNLYMVMERGST